MLVETKYLHKTKHYDTRNSLGIALMLLNEGFICLRAAKGAH